MVNGTEAAIPRTRVLLCKERPRLLFPHRSRRGHSREAAISSTRSILGGYELVGRKRAFDLGAVLTSNLYCLTFR
jgi:hypothetical protein